MQVNNPLDQFAMLSVIGKGSYAKVVLVRKKSNGALYALKSMKKKYIQKKKQENRMITQKQILAQIHHPFLVKLDCSFQNEKKLFFVLQYCPGGQLFGLLVKRKRFTEDQTRFYAAQIVLALSYLHSKNIIYRDLKPENILIDFDGYIKLTDFGLSKNKVYGDQEAFSVCGTPQYLAPEVIKKDGHGKAVDWWCLGSIMYELTHGLPPFYSKNRAELFSKIKGEQPYIPNSWSPNFKNIVGMLLQKNPQIRLKNVEKIKQHPWFESMNWQKLIQKNIKPPFVPVIHNEIDVSNFDREFTECDIDSFEESPDARKNIQGFSYEKSPTEDNDIKIIQQREGSNFVMEIQH